MVLMVVRSQLLDGQEVGSRAEDLGVGFWVYGARVIAWIRRMVSGTRQSLTMKYAPCSGVLSCFGVLLTEVCKSKEELLEPTQTCM